MNTEITMLPVSAGDATLIAWRDDGNSHAVLIDAGLGKHEAISYLQSVGIFHLDLIILSHPDMDHLGGLPAIMNSPAMSVDAVWCFDLAFLREFITTGKIPPPKPATREVLYNYLVRSTLDEFSDILRTANGRGVQVLQVAEGYKLALGGLLLEVLYPPQSFYDSLGDPRALKEMLLNRKWPEDWTKEHGVADGAKARPLSPQERKERLTEMVERLEMPEDLPLLTDLDETSQGEPANHEEDPEKLPWRIVRTLYNNLSIVVKITNLGGIDAPSLLFPGDLSDWTTLILHQWPNLRADVLKLPHHGSNGISFDLKLVRRAFDHWINCYDFVERHDSWWWPGFGLRSRARWLRIVKGIGDRDPVHLLQSLVDPAHVLVFPYPRYGLPSMRLGDFHSKLIANRIDRDPSVLNQKANAPCPARLAVGMERHEIDEVGR
jgi:beta-lactamase superfamily II metal-dependent hydrolase